MFAGRGPFLTTTLLLAFGCRPTPTSAPEPKQAAPDVAPSPSALAPTVPSEPEVLPSFDATAPVPSSATTEAKPIESVPAGSSLTAFRACVARDAKSRVLHHPKPLFEAAGAAELLGRLRGKSVSLSDAAARKELCSKKLPAQLCGEAACSQPEAQFVWHQLTSDTYRGLLVVTDPRGALHAYDAGFAYEFNTELCLNSETKKPLCDRSFAGFDLVSPTHVSLSYHHFASPRRLCNDVENEQNWIFDGASGAIALLLTPPSSIRVTVSETEVSVEAVDRSCAARVTLAELAAEPASEAVDDYAW